MPPTPSTRQDEHLSYGKGEAILLVEDDPPTRMALVEGLESLHYQVLTAINGEQALALIEKRGSEIDLVLSDMVMPDMGGKELFRQLKQQGFDAPIVILTGHPLADVLADLRAEGLDEWLLKPISLDKLAQTLANLLQTPEIQTKER